MARQLGKVGNGAPLKWQAKEQKKQDAWRRKQERKQKNRRGKTLE